MDDVISLLKNGYIYCRTKAHSSYHGTCLLLSSHLASLSPIAPVPLPDFPQTLQTDFYFWSLSLPLPPWTGPQSQGHLPREVFQIFLAKAADPQAVSNLFTAPFFT